MELGLFSAATGMIVKSFVQDVIGRNIANASTTGYKRERAIEGDFASQLNNAIGVPPELQRKSGSYLHSVVTDHSSGALKETGDPFDLAINGDGYFVVEGPNGPMYTRDGSFRVNQNGELVTKEGLRVLSEAGGPIIIPPEVGGSASMRNTLNISEDGTVYTFSGNPLTRTAAGRIRIVDFENKDALVTLGAGFYANPGNAGEIAATGKVAQGVLEMANFGIVDEMVEMIKNQRYYDAGQSVVKAIDKSLGDLFSAIG